MSTNPADTPTLVSRTRSDAAPTTMQGISVSSLGMASAQHAAITAAAGIVGAATRKNDAAGGMAWDPPV